MKRLKILIFLVSLTAVVSNAEDFTLLSNDSSSGDGVRAFWDFSKWLVVSSICTGAGILLGMAATTDSQGDRLPGFIIGGSIGLGTALTVSLLSSSGDSPGQVIGGHVVPVLIGAAAAIIVVPVVVAGLVIWAFLEMLI